MKQLNNKYISGSVRPLRVVTRSSKLALAQTKLVIDALKNQNPAAQFEIVEISTKGDQRQDQPLWKLEGVGFFTAPLENALLEGRGDLAVHSFKDLPTQQQPDLAVAAVPKREHPEDVLVCRQACSSIDALKAGAIVGTSSPRRAAQIKRLRPDVEVRPIRGNVETRLRKVREGEYDATVLARAGLARLGMTDSIGFVFDPCEFIPAPAQGALAIQTRAEDAELIELTRGINDNITEETVAAERRVLELLHPGCHAPVGVYAKIEEGKMSIIAFAAGPDGSPYVREEVCGPAADSITAAEQLAAILIEKGAKEIIEQYE